jgi:phage gpG-like protein
VSVDIEVRGLLEVQRNLTRIAEELSGAPMVQAMQEAALYVTADARRLAPVDTGRLRASIIPDVRMMTNEVVGVVGSNVVYAPYMEFGTRPHWAPPGALSTWARRHGRTEFYIRSLIATRGLKPRKYLQGGFEANKTRIVARIERAVGEITK